MLTAVFFLSDVPDIKNEDQYHLNESTANVTRSLWTRPHFAFAVMAQFLYVVAQAGIFSFFINYMTSQVPTISENWNAAWTRAADGGGFLQVWFSGWFRRDPTGTLAISDKGAANLASLAFVLFLLGRFVGAGILRKISGHRLLAIVATVNVGLCLLVFAKLGWLSVVCVYSPAICLCRLCFVSGPPSTGLQWDEGARRGRSDLRDEATREEQDERA